MLRCKVGDLCVIVKDDFPENIGKFGIVVGRANPEDYFASTDEEWEFKPATPLFGWNNDSKTSFVFDMDIVAMKDSDLRPIRDQPGADESLSWCDVPKEVAA